VKEREREVAKIEKLSGLKKEKKKEISKDPKMTTCRFIAVAMVQMTQGVFQV